MHLAQLRIHNFRCLAQAELEPTPGINLVVGDNAAGKSSLLEAIYFLGRAQSFRSTPGDRLIRSGEHELSVFGRLRTAGSPDTPLGVQRANGQCRIKIGAQDRARMVELVSALPIQVIDPRLHALLEEGPDQRRHFLDWGVFHVEQGFYPAWRNFQRALRQRNQALRRQAAPAQITAWDAEVVRHGEWLDNARRRYLESLGEILPALMQTLFEHTAVSLDYAPGWTTGKTLTEALVEGFTRDREQGHTGAGPHRADLRIRLQGLPARNHASRGEQKLISAGLLLAQAELQRRRTGHPPILLIDDLAAELDARSRTRLFGAIRQHTAQCFLSFLEASQIPSNESGETMFHVEHGRIRRGS